MPKQMLRLALPVVAAALAILAVVSATSDGPDGERTATAAPTARPLLDPEGRPAAVPRRPNVVVLIFDEWTVDSLLDRRRRIDAARFPNLASFSRNATWFPNAFTVYDSTPKAVPLVMDGRRPYKGQPADRRGHRRTLFDMFGRRGYRITASEEATAICPRRWCRNARSRRPGILRNLNRGRVERLERFFRTIKPGRRPGFWLKHVLFPHGPYLYLPSGARTRNGARDPVPGMNSPGGYHDRFLTHHNYQRYLLQMGFVDRELGKLFRRLVRLGMLDSTMVVLAADHGFAWEVGVKDRRRVTNGNVDEIGPVPLFIKSPGQRAGRINRSYVSTLDVAPTIADILDFRLPYRASGRSAFSRAVRRRRVVRLPTRDFSRIVRISARRYERRRRANVRRRLELFGAGAEGLFAGIGPNRDLVGRRVAELRRAGRARARAGLAGARSLRRVRRASGLVPAHIAGTIRRGRRRAKRNIAVAVNGVIRAVGRTWYLRGSPRERFAVMVPEGSLAEGANRVEIYEVGRGKVLRSL